MVSNHILENNHLPQLHQFIEQYSFSTLISLDEEGVHDKHTPVMLEREKGPYGTLIWHMARLNPHVNRLNNGKGTLFIFHASCHLLQ